MWIKSGEIAIPLSQWQPNSEDAISISDLVVRVPYLARALELRQLGVARMPFDVVRGDEVQASEGNYGGLAFVEQLLQLLPSLVGDLDRYGAAYIEIMQNQYGLNITLRRLHPATITPQFDSAGKVTHYTRSIVGKLYRIEPEQLVAIWTPNAEGEVGHGVGIVTRALQSAQILWQSGKVHETFFSTGAIDPMLISIDGYNNLPESDKESIKSRLRRMMLGIKNAFGAVFTGSNVKVTPLRNELMDYAGLIAQKREDIATGLGVPHSLIMSNAANYATASQDDIHFYDKTIIPLCQQIAAALNPALFARFGMALVWRPQRLEVFQRLEVDKSDKVATMFRDGALTIEEYREALGFSAQMPSEVLTPNEAKAWDVYLPPVASIEAVTTSASRERQEALDDLNLWRKVAKRRADEGKATKALSFEASALTDDEQEAFREGIRAENWEAGYEAAKGLLERRFSHVV
jgi:HK97 family phage portal protein